MWLAFAAELDGALEDVDHLDAGVAVRMEAGAVLAGEELGEAGAKAAFGDEDAEALGDVVGVGRAVGKAEAFAAALDAEDAVSGGLEEPGEVLVEDEGDAGEVAEGGDDAAGFELREEAGGEAGEAAELDETHGALEAEALDALAELGGGEEGLGGGGVDGEVVGGLGGLRGFCGARYPAIRRSQRPSVRGSIQR